MGAGRILGVRCFPPAGLLRNLLSLQLFLENMKGYQKPASKSGVLLKELSRSSETEDTEGEMRGRAWREGISASKLWKGIIRCGRGFLTFRKDSGGQKGRGGIKGEEGFRKRTVPGFSSRTNVDPGGPFRRKLQNLPPPIGKVETNDWGESTLLHFREEKKSKKNV